MNRRATTSAAAIKLAIFALVSLLMFWTLAATLGNFSLGTSTSEYRALLTSATGLVPGDDVRVAGVVVGRVEEVEVTDTGRALVTFAVSDVPLTRDSRAHVNYLNLIGNRYLSLQRGREDAELLPEGGTIPISHTRPALDLNALLDGFQPLFTALTPKDVNALALDVVQTMQGEGGTVESLLQHVASLTSSLANRERIVDSVITNLNGVLGNLDRHQADLSEFVVQMRRFVGGLAADRKVIGEALAHVNGLSDATADLLQAARPPLKGDIDQLRRLTATLVKPKNKKALEHTVTHIPKKMARINRTAGYGSWFNYYLCDVSGRIVLPDLPGDLDAELQSYLNDLEYHVTAPRCAYR